jgi:hypothetical protein
LIELQTTNALVAPGAFLNVVHIADIVAVNGQAVKGTMVFTGRTTFFRPSPTPGQAVADGRRNFRGDGSFEILTIDGTPIGSIMFTGLNGGSAAPGAPLAQTADNFAIVGGTGAFFGARGELGSGVSPRPVPIRASSIREDPASRRTNGGGNWRFILSVIPWAVPEIIKTSTGPAVVHASDFTPVTAAKPASAGESLILYATGLGPTQPGIDPGKPFSATPQQVVNSPMQVMVNATPAGVSYAGGFPDSVDGYHVNFRLPPATPSGEASLKLTVGFITGPEVKIAFNKHSVTLTDFKVQESSTSHCPFFAPFLLKDGQTGANRCDVRLSLFVDKVIGTCGQERLG